MLYLIGLGMNEKSISLEAREAVEKCGKIYLENYTVEFPYAIKELEEAVGKKVIPANRELVESEKLINEAKKENIALLVYGSPLFATTHITLIQEAKKKGIRYGVIYNASVLDSVAETGLQVYKFGKITSLPNFEADSFVEAVRGNQKINSHSLILVDIGMKFGEAVKRLEKIAEGEKIVVCSRLGTKEKKIFYGSLNELGNKKVKAPFCFIIPGKLHFMEKEVLESFS